MGQPKTALGSLPGTLMGLPLLIEEPRRAQPGLGLGSEVRARGLGLLLGQHIFLL